VVIDQGQLSTDLTGGFPLRSSKGNWYVIVFYSYDCNYVKPVPMKSRSSSEWLKAYGRIHRDLTSKGFKPKLQTLENEASTKLSCFTENDIEYQRVPPHYHRRNAAERAIRTFKENFAAGLASADLDFTFNLWDCLLPQAQMTLNLLRTSRQHPQLSDAAHYHGMIDYNKTSFSAPGNKIVAHEKPSQRRTWAPHG
jgi:hypothetical protein